MRLHRLELQAFGPYGGAEAVDFDALSSHGLHLIHGATGAGKSSILDGVCFALYGRVPGTRSGQRETLVSDHARAGTRPFVRLEFTVAGRRLRIERSPEHTAPKKRGTGTTRRPAGVLLEELRDGRWAGLATRLDEAGGVIQSLLGMHLDQFAQVVLLPQGQFAHFLRAKPEERGEVLGRLFDITRFSDVEDFLVDHRRRLRATAAEFDRRVHADLARAEEAICAVDLDIDYDRWHECDPTALPDRVARATTALERLATTVMSEADRSATRRDGYREALSAAETVIRLQAQASEARATIDRYAARSDQRAADRRRLDRARAAELVAPHLTARDHRDRVHREAATAYRDAFVSVRDHGVHVVDGDDPDCETLRVRVDAGTEALVAAAPAAHRSEVLTAQIARQTEQVANLSADVDTLTGQLDDARRQLTEHAEARRTAEAAAAELPSAVGRLEAIDTVTQALRALTEHRSAQERARRRTRLRATEFAELEEQVLTLRRRRLDGIAAELALDLTDGSPCAVCGSRDHPSPASPAPDGVRPDDIERAETSAREAGEALSTAKQDEAAADARVEGARATLTSALSAMKHDVSFTGDGTDSNDGAAALREHLDALRAEAAVQVEVATEAEGARARAAERVEVLEATISTLEDRRGEAREAHTVAVTTLEARRTDLADCRRRLREALADHADRCVCPATDDVTTSLDDARALHAETDQRIDDLARARAARETARDEFDRSERQLTDSLERHEFASAKEAAAAAMTEDEQAHLRAALDTADQEYAAAQGVLALPQIGEAVTAEPPDLDTLKDALTEATREAKRAQSRQTAVERAGQSLQTLHTRLAATLQQSAPVRAELETIEPLTDVVTGDGDNQLRMRLTSYVLAARLETVTALANEKLHVMTGGRFSLEHTDALARRGAKSGLGLRVRDAWTGVSRDTATLSGGESFMASLALALGLGEAVLQTSGGRSLQTLFVDEGFGSLDETSLEQVMEVLDGLRAGGRAVGIVSHVRELRDRIPAQVHVRKTSSGSTIDVIQPRHDAA